MSGWIVVQIILNIGFVAAALVCWARLNRPQKDDPRLSRGLQLLQSKIAILEDLSDRTDMQVKQLSTLLDQKGREVQEYVANAQNQIHKVEDSIQKSMDVSKIFQDKIPHKEIIERQNTIKYVQAARLANQGMSVDEIAEKVDIPRSELEFIVKVNKNKLMFSEEHLPEWVQEPQAEVQPSIRPRDFSSVFESSAVNAAAQEDDKKIQEEFKKAIEEVKAKDLARENSMANVVAGNVSESVTEGLQTAKSKISDFAERILNPYFLDKSTDGVVPAVTNQISEQITAKKIIKSEDEDARAVKSFVFKNLDKDL
ncbi:MAG: DUF2802 domain-containing protein [Bdellovibrionota bacterium]